MRMLMVLLMAYARPQLLVDSDWLAKHLSDPDIRIVDMRAQGFDASHIPGSVYLANAAIRDTKRPPEFVPSKADFEKLMSQLGISDGTRVIAYDELGGIYAARLWWILNYYGHSNVALMNGGWIKWTAAQRPASTTVAAPAAATFSARPQRKWVATASDVVGAIDKPGVKIIEARTQSEIEGKD